MRKKTILTVLGAALIVASTQIVAGAERHPMAKPARAPVSQYRNANNSVAAPAPSGWAYGGFSAPAGH